jgi:hypothetical protein
MSSNLPTFDSRKIAKALCKKGFEPSDEINHHKYLDFWYNGEITEIRTYFSHDIKTQYSAKGGGLLHNVKDQLKFDNIKDTIKFIECTYTHQNYIDMLLDKQEIK